MIDVVRVGVDAGASLATAIWLFATTASAWIIAARTIAAMVPDPVQFEHSSHPREPLSHFNVVMDGPLQA
ncbi:hypothetical protein CQ10_41430 [Bradyrhizobium valentinum]|nr:hypothetical protein CQ10_41430 [Bradyrhizobium valentinum]